jgi:hypothetical protein
MATVEGPIFFTTPGTLSCPMEAETPSTRIANARPVRNKAVGFGGADLKIRIRIIIPETSIALLFQA